MSDLHFSTPISKDRDDNAIGNPIFVQVSDGVEIIQVNADGSINIGAIVPGVGPTDLGKAEDAVHASGDTGVMSLAVRKDTAAALAGADGDYIPLITDANGRLHVVLSSNTELTPLYVQVVDTVVSGNEIIDYDTAADVAAGGTSNHDYTVVGTAIISQLIVAGSGNVKFELQYGEPLSLATALVGFLTGRDGDTKVVPLDPPLEVPKGTASIVRLVRTNRQNQAVDVYSTIFGKDV